MRYILVVLMLFTCAKSNAQVNLVRNPSFEQYDTCPSNLDQISFATYWMSLDTSFHPPSSASSPGWALDPAGGVPEYFNACAGYFAPYSGVPLNQFCFQYAHTGNGMASEIMFYNEWTSGVPEQRNYLQGKLYATLTAGQTYCVTFYVVEDNGPYSSSHIGAYFDDGTIDTTHNYGHTQTQYTPQVFEDSLITDTLHWTKVQGSFIATGTEQFITIGNFTDTAHMHYRLNPGHTDAGTEYSYYAIDDVSVIPMDAVAVVGPHIVLDTPGMDSVVIGDTLDTYLPGYWYMNGSLIDSNKASIKVRPDTTTQYVMALVLCSNTSYDTVMVYVHARDTVKPRLGVNELASKPEVTVWPNPAHNELTVTNAAGSQLVIYDLIGSVVYQTTVITDKEQVGIESLPKGLYMVQVTDGASGTRKILKVVRE